MIKALACQWAKMIEEASAILYKRITFEFSSKLVVAYIVLEDCKEIYGGVGQTSSETLGPW